MKRTFLIALAATVVLSASSAVHAQGMRVCLVDVGYIFKNHPGFESMRTALDADVAIANAEFQKRREDLEGKQQQLAGMVKSSPDYTNLEAAIAREAAEVNAAFTLKRNKFAEREAGIYYQIYNDIRDATSQVCSQNQIHLALQFNGQPINQDNPSMVQADVARKVVYYDKGIDITGQVMQLIQQRAGTAAAGTGVRRQ